MRVAALATSLGLLNDDSVGVEGEDLDRYDVHTGRLSQLLAIDAAMSGGTAGVGSAMAGSDVGAMGESQSQYSGA